MQRPQILIVLIREYLMSIVQNPKCHQHVRLGFVVPFLDGYVSMDWVDIVYVLSNPAKNEAQQRMDR